MDKELNRRIARSFLENIGTLDPDRLRPMMGDPFVFKTMFRSKGHPLIAELPQDEFFRFLLSAQSIFPNRCRHQVVGTVAEGDLVAVETECFAEMSDGRLYNNLFHFHIRLTLGKIVEVREYGDFLHAQEVLFPAYCIHQVDATGAA